MLKPKSYQSYSAASHPAAFGRLRVETVKNRSPIRFDRQPPSGGCVLKLHIAATNRITARPAAFGRLRVETLAFAKEIIKMRPAAFGRLRVETVFAPP